MNFSGVTLLEDIISLYHLSIKHILSPHSGVFELAGKVLVDFFGQGFQGTALWKHKGRIHIGFFARRLAVNAYDPRDVINSKQELF